MRNKNLYLAVDLDKETFRDDAGHFYDADEVRIILNEAITGNRKYPDLTLMAARLVNQFNFDFGEARKFYNSIR